MDIQPRGLFLAIALHHAVKLPAVTLIKRGVVSSKVKVRAASMPLAANVTPHSGAGQRAACGIWPCVPWYQPRYYGKFCLLQAWKKTKNARDTSLFESLKKAKLPWPVAPLYGITLDCTVVYV